MFFLLHIRGLIRCVDCDLVLAGLLERFLGAVGMGTVRTGRLAFDVEDGPVDEGETVRVKDEL